MPFLAGSPPTHRALLRAATRAAHERVDAKFSRFDLTTRPGYRSFLATHSAVLPALEATLSRSGAADLLPDWPTRLRAPSLAADLVSIGGTSRMTADGANEPVDAPAALGMLYVLEGSRLGGAVLAGRVANNVDADCRGATRYLRHGERRGLWASFVAAFDASEHVRDNPDEVIGGALTAFDLFARATDDARARP